MNNEFPVKTLRALTDKLIDSGSLSDAELAKLETLLANDAAREWFISSVHDSALIEAFFDGKTGSPEKPVVATKSNIVWYRRLATFSTGFAAAVVLGLGIFGAKIFSPAPPPIQTAARVTGLVGVIWDKSVSASLTDNGLAPDYLALRAGLAEVTYGNGVRVTVQGPCHFSITGQNTGKLDYGKLVAYVPPVATGFSVDYAHGKITDIGTEFAMDVAHDGNAEVGVFEGEIKVQRTSDKEVLSLFANQALAMPVSGEAQSVPLNREKFIRRIPTRDFRWEAMPGKTLQFSADVSHLIWKSAEYIAIFKSFQGPGSVRISQVRLLRDGQEIARDAHTGLTRAAAGVSSDNVFRLNVSQDNFSNGQWTLEATLDAPSLETPGLAHPYIGILQLEEGFILHATAKDFIGSWFYPYGGYRYERRFLPDGTAQLLRDGVTAPMGFSNARWKIKDNELLTYSDNFDFVERHALRDPDTLIFLNAPYENAKREAVSEK
ncbi:MAG: FecR family protein [Puniceicoccales bacterium]|jgi:hypothetical protein|nr:FecR family protein [Puniceicoccales bacterium]